MAQIQGKLNTLKSDIFDKISEVGDQFQESFKEERVAIASTVEAKALIHDGNVANLTTKVDTIQSTVDAILHGCAENTENSEKVLKDLKETDRVVGKTAKALESCNSTLEHMETAHCDIRDDVKKILKAIETLDVKCTATNVAVEGLHRKQESLEALVKDRIEALGGHIDCRFDHLESQGSGSSSSKFSEEERLRQEKQAKRQRLQAELAQLDM